MANTRLRQHVLNNQFEDDERDSSRESFSSIKTSQPVRNSSIFSHKLGIAVVICSLLLFGTAFSAHGAPVDNDSTAKVTFHDIINNQAHELMEQAKQLVTEVTPLLNSLKAGEEKVDRKEEGDLDENGFERKNIYETGAKKGQDGSFEIYKSSSSKVEVHRETSPLMAEIEARKKKYRPDYKP